MCTEMYKSCRFWLSYVFLNDHNRAAMRGEQKERKRKTVMEILRNSCVSHLSGIEQFIHTQMLTYLLSSNDIKYGCW